MKICLISGSSRDESQSLRVTLALKAMLEAKDIDTSLLDLNTQNLSNRLNDAWENVNGQGDLLATVKETVADADGFVVVTPEWSGMASPAVKNLFTVVDGFAHKPAMIVAVSISRGGAYPVAELRMSSYKNSKIVYIPDHLIVRDAATAFTGDGSKNDVYTTKRAQFSLDALVAYAEALKPLRGKEFLFEEEYANGM